MTGPGPGALTALLPSLEGPSPGALTALLPSQEGPSTQLLQDISYASLIYKNS